MDGAGDGGVEGGAVPEGVAFGDVEEDEYGGFEALELAVGVVAQAGEAEEDVGEGHAVEGVRAEQEDVARGDALRVDEAFEDGAEAGAQAGAGVGGIGFGRVAGGRVGVGLGGVGGVWAEGVEDGAGVAAVGGEGGLGPREGGQGGEVALEDVLGGVCPTAPEGSIAYDSVASKRG